MSGIREVIIKLHKNKTIRNGGLYSMYSFFNKGISFLLLVILAKYITPNQYGSLSLFSTIVLFLGFTVGLSTSGYLSVSFFKKKLNDFKADLTSIIVISFIGSLFFLIIFLIFKSWLSGTLKQTPQLLYVALYNAFSNIIVSLVLDYYRVKENIKGYGIISCSYAILNFGITLYLVVFIGYGWYGYVYSQTLLNLIYSAFSLFYFYRKELLKISKNWNVYKTILLWGTPLIPHVASSWIKQGLDRYIIDYHYSLTDVGLFSFALTLANIIQMVGVAFNQTNSVNIYQTLSNKNLHKIEKIRSLRKKENIFLIVYLFTTILISLGICFLIPLVMPKYVNSLSMFYILAFYALLNCYYLIYCNYLYYFNKTLILMYITFGSAVLHFVLSLLFTKYSLYLTCVIYLICQSLITLLVYINSRRILNDYVK